VPIYRQYSQISCDTNPGRLPLVRSYIIYLQGSTAKVRFLPKTPEQNNWAQNDVSLSSADTRTLRTDDREERYLLSIFVC
jgi:hypothetical protein